MSNFQGSGAKCGPGKNDQRRFTRAQHGSYLLNRVGCHPRRGKFWKGSADHATFIPARVGRQNQGCDLAGGDFRCLHRRSYVGTNRGRSACRARPGGNRPSPSFRISRERGSRGR